MTGHQAVGALAAFHQLQAGPAQVMGGRGRSHVVSGVAGTAPLWRAIMGRPARSARGGPGVTVQLFHFVTGVAAANGSVTCVLTLINQKVVF